jgi:hypothetical protein
LIGDLDALKALETERLKMLLNKVDCADSEYVVKKIVKKLKHAKTQAQETLPTV